MQVEYPDDWDTRRREIYRRDDYECQNCGSQGGYNGDTELHAHHIVPISEGGTHKKSNLVTVCKDCHSKIHGYPIGSQKKAKNTTREDKIDKFETKIEEKEVDERVIAVAMSIFIFLFVYILIALLIIEIAGGRLPEDPLAIIALPISIGVTWKIMVEQFSIREVWDS